MFYVFFVWDVIRDALSVQTHRASVAMATKTRKVLPSWKGRRGERGRPARWRVPFAFCLLLYLSFTPP